MGCFGHNYLVFYKIGKLLSCLSRVRTAKSFWLLTTDKSYVVMEDINVQRLFESKNSVGRLK